MNDYIVNGTEYNEKVKAEEVEVKAIDVRRWKLTFENPDSILFG